MILLFDFFFAILGNLTPERSEALSRFLDFVATLRPERNKTFYRVYRLFSRIWDQKAVNLLLSFWPFS